MHYARLLKSRLKREVCWCTVINKQTKKTPLKAIIREGSRDPFLFVLINDSKVSNNNNNNNNNDSN